MEQRIYGITGWKNSGKTTLTARLVRELTGRGLKVSTVKHAHHAFEIDREGTDSFRHRGAGASEVAIVSGTRWALMHELRAEPEPSLADVIARLSPCDLVLIEGYKRESHPKIECRRADAVDRRPMQDRVPAIAAIAADHAVTDSALPLFDLDDIAALADFVMAETGLS